MTPNFAYIYEKHADKDLKQLKRKKRYLEKKLKEEPSDPIQIDNGQQILYQVTLDIVNELIRKKLDE